MAMNNDTDGTAFKLFVACTGMFLIVVGVLGLINGVNESRLGKVSLPLLNVWGEKKW
jgi:hypothetical protein